VQITVERCDKIMVTVSHIFDRVISVALWSANIRKLAKDHKGYGSATTTNITDRHDIIEILLNIFNEVQ
jgi:hypothetical protein